MFIEGLTYPFSKENTVKTLGLGTLYTFGMILIFPLFLLAGYYAHVVAKSSPTDERLPDAGNIGALFIDGLKMTAVTLVYGAGFVLGMGILWGVGIYSESGILLLFALLLSIPFAVVYYMVMLGGIVNFCKNDFRMIKAFDLDEIREFAFTGKFTIAVLIAIFAYPLIEGMILSFLSLTIIGLVVYPTVYFFFFIAMGYVFSVAYDDVHGTNTQETDSEEDMYSVDY